MPIQSKGGYQLDFDNLDNIDPFQGSVKMVLSPARPAVETPSTDQNEFQLEKPDNMLEEPTKIESALDETLPFTPSVENSLVDVSTDVSSTDSSVVTVVRAPAVFEQDSLTATPDGQQCANMSTSVNQNKASTSFEEEAPLPSKGSYNFDFDDIDAINPFQAGGSKIPNSPVIGRKVPDNNPPAEEKCIEETLSADIDIPEVVQEAVVHADVKPIASMAPISSSATADDESTPQLTAAPNKEAPIVLEFNFDDGSEVKPKPPLKKFAKRPPGLKSKERKSVSDVKPAKDMPEMPGDSDVAVVTAPKGTYSFDLEKFDDLNFNPFGTKSTMNNSPQSSRKPSAVLTETDTLDQTDQPVEEVAASPARYVNISFECIYLQCTLHSPKQTTY